MAKLEAGKVVLLDDKAEFDAFLEAAGSNLVVIDFFADWCGPCKIIGPKLAAMAEEFKEKGVYFAKVNVDENSEVAESEGISAMPTFKYYKNGEKVDELVGANEMELRKKIEANK